MTVKMSLLAMAALSDMPHSPSKPRKAMPLSLLLANLPPNFANVKYHKTACDSDNAILAFGDMPHSPSKPRNAMPLSLLLANLSLKPCKHKAPKTAYDSDNVTTTLQ
jgi:hypothetical protein